MGRRGSTFPSDALVAIVRHKRLVCFSAQEPMFVEWPEREDLTHCGPSRGWNLCLKGGRNAIATDSRMPDVDFL